MNGVGKRKIRKPQSKTDVKDNVPRKWSENEIKILHKGLMKYGHKNITELQNLLPDRSLENIKCFMRTVFDTAGKCSQGHSNVDAWINRCSGACLKETPWKDSIHVAKVMKYLSVDGLLENHPLPERCNGVNFGEAYRLIYQALMGYPIQPVNKATSDFVMETISELISDVRLKKDVITKVQSFLVENLNSEDKGNTNKTKNSESEKKPIKVYQRKKPKLMESELGEPSVKIIVAPRSSEQGECSTMKDFSVTIEREEGRKESTVLNVAVPVGTEIKIDEEEEELLKSCSYNPFKLPTKWLQEPVYINILQ